MTRRDNHANQENIFTCEGLETFIDDMGKISHLFMHQNFGLREQPEEDDG